MDLCPNCWKAPQSRPRPWQYTELVELGISKSICQVVSGLTRWWMRIAKYTAVVSASLGCTLIIHNYDPKHNQRHTTTERPLDERYSPMGVLSVLKAIATSASVAATIPHQLAGTCEIISRAYNPIMRELSNTGISQRIWDPPPQLFLASGIILLSIIACILHSQNNYQDQHVFVILVVPFGTLLGLLQAENLLIEVKGYFAGSIVAALLVRCSIHEAWRYWYSGQSCDCKERRSARTAEVFEQKQCFPEKLPRGDML
ncbi:hypothetical protein BKA64DRAFT_633759 [Cadophora sp. MPI-SDFR-AT-0126]|nr:hypothetical protein BKA64DRAFT_633759 [Leotiomycetes sp. MPI-SDFR-AT-0126]